MEKITGKKGGGGNPRTPHESPDSLQSIATAKILLALGEGEFAGGLTDKDIFLDGTPIRSADGTLNFPGVNSSDGLAEILCLFIAACFFLCQQPGAVNGLIRLMSLLKSLSGIIWYQCGFRTL